MGWTSFNKSFATTNARGGIDKKATIINEVEAWGDVKIVKAAMAGGNCYCIELMKKTGKHYLVMYLINVDSTDFYYKDITDTMGPCYYDCPKSILDLADKLCPCDEQYDPNGYGRAWRDKCRENIAKKRNPLAFANVKYGDSIIWHVPVGVGWAKEFEGKTLRLTKVKGKRCWVCYELWTGFKTKSVMVEDCEPDNLCKVA